MREDPVAASDLKLLARMGAVMKPDGWLYLGAMLAAPASTVVQVAQPWVLQRAVDQHIVPKQLDGLATLAWAYLGMVLGAFVLETAYTLLLSYGATHTIERLREKVYVHTLGLARSFYDGVPTGKLLTRATSDVEALGETLSAGAVTIVLDVLLVLGILAGMLLMDWKLTLVMLPLAPLIALITDAIRRVLKRLFTEVRTALSELNAFLTERIGGVEIVQLYGDEARAMAEFDVRNARYRDANVRSNVYDALLFAVMDGLTSITMALLLWYGAGGLGDDLVTPGLLAAFIQYVERLFQPIREFSQKVAVLQRAVSALEKIFGLLDVDERIGGGDAACPPEGGTLELRDVSFAYGDGPRVLHDVSLTLRPGEVVAVCGRTGSGKTTLAKLLTRAYQGYTGSIRLGGVELAHMDPHAVRRVIGTVSQDVQLFPGDVRFNLTLGADIPDDRLWGAIRHMRAERVVTKLGGLDGRIEHGGANLSAGEAQLLSFARTMAHDPPIVLLDEATASVDSVTEALIQEATREVLSTKTVLVIAHRLSTIMDADRIALLDWGRVVETGTHGELMAADGRYAALFRSQFAEA